MKGTLVTLFVVFRKLSACDSYFITNMGMRGTFTNSPLNYRSNNCLRTFQIQAEAIEENPTSLVEPEDTIRVRIWKALDSSNKEMTMKELGNIVGERHLGDLKSHLVHVERQAKTIGNKSKEWKHRRGLLIIGGNKRKRRQVEIKKRKGKNGDVYVWLE